jgi:hypothetical protein
MATLKPTPAPPGPPTGAATPAATPNRITKYLKRCVVIFAISAAIDIIVRLVSATGVRWLGNANKSFVSAVRHMDAWHLLVLVYHNFGVEAARHPFGGWLGPLASAVGLTFQQIWSEGFWSILAAAIVLLLGYWGTGERGQPNRMSVAARIFWIPVAGSVLLWVLLQIMLALGWLFGFFLVGAQTVVGLSITVPIFRTVLEERGHHVADVVLKKGEQVAK